MNDVVELITCRRCQQSEVVASKSDRHLCDACVKAENNRVSFLRRANAGWMEIAKEAELQIWERQPGETDHEYHIWLRYRDAYPGKKPTYRDVAEQLVTSIAAVRAVGNRWNFPARLQAWAKHVDNITLAQRQQEILDMNKAHVDMAATLRSKLSKAIEQIDPYNLTPREINSLMKTATELERKARLDVVPVGAAINDDGNPDLKKSDVKQEAIPEILQILAKAGKLSAVGIKQTTTTEVVMKNDDSDDD